MAKVAYYVFYKNPDTGERVKKKFYSWSECQWFIMRCRGIPVRYFEVFEND